MWQYVKKVFTLAEPFARFTDPRRTPTVPLTPLLLTWFWAMVCRRKSTEHVGELFRDRRWRKHLPLKPHHGGSADTAGRVLDGLSIEEWTAWLLDMFFIAAELDCCRLADPMGSAAQSWISTHDSTVKSVTVSPAKSGTRESKISREKSRSSRNTPIKRWRSSGSAGSLPGRWGGSCWRPAKAN